MVFVFLQVFTVAAFIGAALGSIAQFTRKDNRNIDP